MPRHPSILLCSKILDDDLLKMAKLVVEITKRQK